MDSNTNNALVFENAGEIDPRPSMTAPLTISTNLRQRFTPKAEPAVCSTCGKIL